MPFDLDKAVDVSRGRKVTIGARDLTIAPLTLRRIIQASDMLPKLAATASTSESIGILVDFVLIGLARTYPSLTREELLDSEGTVDQLRVASDVIIEQAGAKKVALGADPVGEAKAASDSTAPIGASSSPTSASS